MQKLSALFSGVLFGLGLAISQMSNPMKVLDFLDVTGNWDPSLLLVLGAAVTVTATAFRFVLRMKQPFYDDSFESAPTERITPRLVTGAGLFGIGWGLAGFCPGPGVVALPSLPLGAATFLTAFFLGSLIFLKLFARPSRMNSAPTTP